MVHVFASIAKLVMILTTASQHMARAGQAITSAAWPITWLSVSRLTEQSTDFQRCQDPAIDSLFFLLN